MDIRDYKPSGHPMDLSDVISTICPCGCNLFKTVVAIDEDTYELSMYALDAECLECSTRIKLPCPVDKEERF